MASLPEAARREPPNEHVAFRPLHPQERWTFQTPQVVSNITFWTLCHPQEELNWRCVCISTAEAHLRLGKTHLRAFDPLSHFPKALRQMVAERFDALHLFFSLNGVTG